MQVVFGTFMALYFTFFSPSYEMERILVNSHVPNEYLHLTLKYPRGVFYTPALKRLYRVFYDLWTLLQEVIS